MINQIQFAEHPDDFVSLEQISKLCEALGRLQDGLAEYRRTLSDGLFDVLVAPRERPPNAPTKPAR